MIQNLDTFVFICKECKNDKYWLVKVTESNFMKRKCKFCGAEQ